MIIGVPKETYPGERRVALVPDIVSQVIGKKHEVWVERGAGEAAGFPDSAYDAAGARLAGSRNEVFQKAELIAQVRGLGANPDGYRKDLALMRPGQTVMGFLGPADHPAAVSELAAGGAMGFSLELMPRISRAQNMDALSSMATIAGYKAVILAAEHLPRMFPMLMTAAGVVHPSRVFVIGAGVAGLQAIATSRRLGAVVHAYDVREAAREEIQSLGAKSVDLPLETADVSDSGGYAKRMDEGFYRRQRELMARFVGESNVVVSTAAVPGKKAPVLIARQMVESMAAGSVIVDLAAERGGNCELTRADQTVVERGVTILGPTNLPSSIPYHASQLYSRNIANFIFYLTKDGQLAIDSNDEVVRETLLTKEGQVVQPTIRALSG